MVVFNSSPLPPGWKKIPLDLQHPWILQHGILNTKKASCNTLNLNIKNSKIRFMYSCIYDSCISGHFKKNETICPFYSCPPYFNITEYWNKVTVKCSIYCIPPSVTHLSHRLQRLPRQRQHGWILPAPQPHPYNMQNLALLKASDEQLKSTSQQQQPSEWKHLFAGEEPNTIIKHSETQANTIRLLNL